MLIMVRLPLFCAEGPLLNLLHCLGDSYWCLHYRNKRLMKAERYKLKWQIDQTRYFWDSHPLFPLQSSETCGGQLNQRKDRRLEEGRGHFDRFSEAVTHTLTNIYRNKASDTENLTKVWTGQGSPLLHAHSRHPCIGEPWNNCGRADDQKMLKCCWGLAPTPQSRANGVLCLLLQIKWQAF